MSTLRSTPSPPDLPQPQRDRYFYGWRDVETKDEQGRRKWVRHPLTPHDVLHPREGDHIVQNTDHDDDCFYLRDALRDQVRGEPETLVAHDLGIVWDEPGLEGGHCPDIFLVRGVRNLRRRFDTFNVAKEGVRPELIIEITSPSTRQADLNAKRREYWLARVPVYVILDEQIRRGRRQLRILPYQRGPRVYRLQRLGAHRRFWLEAVQLWLGQENGRVALYDLQGKRLPGYEEMSEARNKVEQNLEQEAEARKIAEEEISRLQAELRRLRGEE